MMTYKSDLKAIPLKLFNTETRVKEVLRPQEKGHVTLYTCGPTVYDFAHIGNFRTYVFEDILRRTIKFFGMKIVQVMNLTDVDDKTIKGAIKNQVSLDAFTQPFKQAFFDDLTTLNIERAEFFPAATDYIGEMVAIIQGLLDKGFAYEGGDGSVYFAIQQFSRYGCLSHLKIEDLKAGASERVAADEYDKEHVADFVLWKSYDPERDGGIYWESPFGRGRPGWHIECSAMSMKLLGQTIDIHCGGVDNMFPHHENEMAQSEAYTDSPFVRIWMHSEHLIVDNKKMSKSLGNFFTLRDLLKRGYTGPQIRYMLLQTHYKTQLNFTFEGLDGVKHTLERLNGFIRRLQEIKVGTATGRADSLLEKAYLGFAKALSDDLNISVALAAIFDMIREVNVLCDQEKIGLEDAKKALNLMKEFDAVLGVLSFEPLSEEIPRDLVEALERRLQARKEKKWQEADQLRDFIYSCGYQIEDTPTGARLKKSI